MLATLHFTTKMSISSVKRLNAFSISTKEKPGRGITGGKRDETRPASSPRTSNRFELTFFLPSLPPSPLSPSFPSRPSGLALASPSMYSEPYRTNASGSSSTNKEKEKERSSTVGQPRTLEPLEKPTMDKGKERASSTYWSDVSRSLSVSCRVELQGREAPESRRLRGLKIVELTASFPSLLPSFFSSTQATAPHPLQHNQKRLQRSL